MPGNPSARHLERVDDAEVMRLWRKCGLPEYFLGNGGSNRKLVAFARECGLVFDASQLAAAASLRARAQEVE